MTHSESDSRAYVVFGFVGPAKEDLGFRALRLRDRHPMMILKFKKT